MAAKGPFPDRIPATTPEELETQRALLRMSQLVRALLIRGNMFPTLPQHDITLTGPLPIKSHVQSRGCPLRMFMLDPQEFLSHSIAASPMENKTLGHMVTRAGKHPGACKTMRHVELFNTSQPCRVPVACTYLLSIH